MHLFTSEATGDRETMMRMSWPDHSEIHRITIVEVAWLKPEDEYETLQDHGPLQAGEMVEVAPDGTQLVKVASSKRWKKQTRLVEKARKTTKRGDDEDVIGKEVFASVWDAEQRGLHGFSGLSSQLALPAPTISSSSSAVAAPSASAGL